MNFPLTAAFNVFHMFGLIVYLLPGNFNIFIINFFLGLLVIL